MKKIIVTLSIVITSCISMMAIPAHNVHAPHHYPNPAMHCICRVCRDLTRDLMYHNRPGARPCNCRGCHETMMRLEHHHRNCRYDCRRPEPHRMGNHHPGPQHYGNHRGGYRR